MAFPVGNRVYLIQKVEDTEYPQPERTCTNPSNPPSMIIHSDGILKGTIVHWHGDDQLLTSEWKKVGEVSLLDYSLSLEH